MRSSISESGVLVRVLDGNIILEKGLWGNMKVLT